MTGPAASFDDIIFADEATHGGTADRGVDKRPSWRIMIVDDDADVHAATTFALAGTEIVNRPLSFLHAYSAAHARQLLAQERDIAVVLLDVVMEKEDAGLQLVRYIREVLGLGEVRIILRTGQPGYAPELEAIRDFDINDYKTKTELTRVKLYTTVTAAIRSYEHICRIATGRRGLDRIVRATTELMALHGLDNFASGVLTQTARLLDCEPSGVLCMQETHGAALLPMVVAATGRLARCGRDGLQGEDCAPVAGLLKQALAQRKSIYSGQAAALYFGGDADRSFAACLDTPHPVPEFSRRLLDVFCRNIAVGLHNVLLVSRLHKSAFYDQLTGLPNRTRLKELLELVLAGPQRDEATLALVDIDHFSETNDALGHQFGDLLLLGVADRLRSCFGARMTISRVGGDTFGVVGCADQVTAENLLAMFGEPFRIDGQQVQVSATAGLLRLTEHDGGAADALKDADIALKRAKLRHRGGYLYFSRSMGVDIRERVRLMHALRAAIGLNELFVVYQPQVDLATRRPIGAEALLRWKTADGEFISPDRFIPIAEYSGLIIEIGACVLREACTQLQRLHRGGHDGLTMSVNVSQVQFRDPHFLDMLRKVLADTGAPAHCLELEITESFAMEEPEALIELLAQIKQTGVSIAIDDFGTGYSSLNQLQRLRADRLKIDRSFVTEITSSNRGGSIAEMVIQLGRNLGMSVVAEGVEDEQQAQILRALGCPLAQGYLFARPMDIEQLMSWLDGPG